MVESEIDISKKRWETFKEMIKIELPNCSVEIIDDGRNERYWKVRLSHNVGSTEVLLCLKPSRKVMTFPNINYENCFSEGIKEVQRVLKTPIPKNQFYGTIIIYKDDPFFHFKDGEVSNDDEW